MATALRTGALEVAAAAKSGLLSVALAALAAGDVAVRQQAYAALAEALAALPEASFKEKPQLALLLHAVRA